MLASQALEIFKGLGKILITKSDKYWKGQCLNPQHRDNNPSMRVDARYPHFFKCWACGYTGTLSNIAKQYGIEVDKTFSIPDKLHKSPILPNLENLVLRDWTESYRGFTKEHWNYFGAKKWYDYIWNLEKNEWELFAERLWLPIYMHGSLISYTGRRLDDLDFIRYKNFEGGFISEILYPYDLMIPGNPIVLVEGPLDAIKFNLYQIPTLCIFGVGNWSQYKLRLLLQKAPSTIWLCMDGDERGQEAQKMLKNKLKLYGDIQDIKLAEGCDPFDLIPELTLHLRDQIWNYHQQKAQGLVTLG
jgi:DNA primase